MQKHRGLQDRTAFRIGVVVRQDPHRTPLDHDPAEVENHVARHVISSEKTIPGPQYAQVKKIIYDCEVPVAALESSAMSTASHHPVAKVRTNSFFLGCN